MKKRKAGVLAIGVLVAIVAVAGSVALQKKYHLGSDKRHYLSK